MTTTTPDDLGLSGPDSIRTVVLSSSATVATALIDAVRAAGAPLSETFSSAEAVTRALRSAPEAVALIDLDGTGEPDLTALKSVTEGAPDSPVIAVTAVTDEWLAIGALQLGAQECLVRGTDDLRPDLLRRALRNAVLRRGTVVEQQLERAFDQAPIGMAILDSDERLLRVNLAVMRILGRTRDELVGHRLGEFSRPGSGSDGRSVGEPLHPVADGQQISERRLRRADGREIWIELAVSPMGDLEGNGPRLVAQLQDVTERRAQVDRLRHIADHDQLTGVLNRRGFERELGAHLNRVSRYGAAGALAMFDLDHFKAHNDNFGHDAGDELLSRLGDALRGRLRSSDVIGRLGGDEFAVLLPDADRDRAVLVAGILLEQIQKSTGSLLSAAASGVTASIGLVCFGATGPIHLDVAKRYADEAMYTAKRRGGDQYAEWTPWTVHSELGTVAA